MRSVKDKVEGSCLSQGSRAPASVRYRFIQQGTIRRAASRARAAREPEESSFDIQKLLGGGPRIQGIDPDSLLAKFPDNMPKPLYTDGTKTPSQVAAEFVAPALREIDQVLELPPPVPVAAPDNGMSTSSSITAGSPGHISSSTATPQRSDEPDLLMVAYHPPDCLPGVRSGAVVSSDTLDRWRTAYSAMVHDAQALGIPRSAIPSLQPDASAQDIRAARDHLESMMASFLSSCL